MTKIAAAYIRVSTDDQLEYSPESQIELIQDYAKRNNMILPSEFIFQDGGISGRKAEKRPEFMKMISTAKQKPRPFEIILVWKFSRFARNQEESILYKSLLQRENQIEVTSVSEPLIEGPFGSLIERIIEWMDEYYSIRLSGEVLRGMEKRVTGGEFVSIAPYGYIVKDKELIINEEEAETVKMMYKDFLSGMSLYAIARKLQSMGIKTRKNNDWQNRTVRYCITNPVYIGKLRWCPSGANDYYGNTTKTDTIYVDGKHSPVITQEVYQEAQNRLEQSLKSYRVAGEKRSQQQAPGTRGDHMLRGVLKCSNCGSTMTRVKDGYNCVSYAHSGCIESHYISILKIVPMVLAALENQLQSLDFTIIHKSSQLSVDEHELVVQQLSKAQNALSRYKEAYAAGVDTIEEYRANKQRSTQLIKEIEQHLIAAPINNFNKESYVAQRKNDLIMLRAPDVPETSKNELLRSFVDKIVYLRSTNSIVLYFYA